ncbi:hypothetical protein AB0J20_10035 [Micromonospora costi]|uniref:hypothetical protein n=1 Tax=Micromonospora costi TaxID=1530042 RepID=UPI0033F7B911
MTASEADLRKYHYANYRSVSQALTHIERAGKMAIRRNEVAAIRSLVQTQMLLVAIKAEARLMKLLYLPNGFSDTQRSTVLAQPSVYERWVSAVDIGYRSAFNIATGVDVTYKLLHDDVARYTTIQRVLDTRLRPIIGIRNKLAHGQWSRPLNQDKSDVDQDSCRFIAQENVWTLILRDDALEGIANIIGDLMQSRRLYQARFNLHYKRVQRVDRVLTEKSYEEWVRRLQASYRSGLEMMRSNLDKAVRSD